MKHIHHMRHFNCARRCQKTKDNTCQNHSRTHLVNFFLLYNEFHISFECRKDCMYTAPELQKLKKLKSAYLPYNNVYVSMCQCINNYNNSSVIYNLMQTLSYVHPQVTMQSMY